MATMEGKRDERRHCSESGGTSANGIADCTVAPRSLYLAYPADLERMEH